MKNTSFINTFYVITKAKNKNKLSIQMRLRKLVKYLNIKITNEYEWCNKNELTYEDFFMTLSNTVCSKMDWLFSKWNRM